MKLPSSTKLHAKMRVKSMGVDYEVYYNFILVRWCVRTGLGEI